MSASRNTTRISTRDSYAEAPPSNWCRSRPFVVEWKGVIVLPAQGGDPSSDSREWRDLSGDGTVCTGVVTEDGSGLTVIKVHCLYR